MEEIFSAAVELPEADRAAFLERECGGNTALRTEVESLLRADSHCPALFTAVRRETRSLLEMIGRPGKIEPQ